MKEKLKDLFEDLKYEVGNVLDTTNKKILVTAAMMTVITMSTYNMTTNDKVNNFDNINQQVEQSVNYVDNVDNIDNIDMDEVVPDIENEKNTIEENNQDELTDKVKLTQEERQINRINRVFEIDNTKQQLQDLIYTFSNSPTDNIVNEIEKQLGEKKSAKMLSMYFLNNISTFGKKNKIITTQDIETILDLSVEQTEASKYIKIQGVYEKQRLAVVMDKILQSDEELEIKYGFSEEEENNNDNNSNKKNNGYRSI